MELLTIQHEDFELSIECAKFETVWEKARNNVGEERGGSYVHLFLV